MLYHVIRGIASWQERTQIDPRRLRSCGFMVIVGYVASRGEIGYCTVVI